MRKRYFRKGIALLLSAALALTSAGAMPWLADTKSAEAAETAGVVAVKTLKGAGNDWWDAGNEKTECGNTFYVYGMGNANPMTMDVTDGTHYLSINPSQNAWWTGVQETTAQPVTQGALENGITAGHLFKVAVVKSGNDFTITFHDVTDNNKEKVKVTASSSEFSDNITVMVQAQTKESNIMVIDSAEEISSVIPVTDGTLSISDGSKLKYGFKVKGNAGTEDLNIPIEINGKVVTKTVQAKGENAWCEIKPKESGSYAFSVKNLVQNKKLYAADGSVAKSITIAKNDTGIVLDDSVDYADPGFNAAVKSTQEESFENSIDGKTVGSKVSENASNATPAYVGGYSGKGVSFSGTGSDGIELNIKPTSKRYVLSFWMNAKESTANTPAIFIANYDSNGVIKGGNDDAQWISIATQGWQASLDAGPMVWSRNVPGNASWNDLIPSTKGTLSLNAWHKVAVAADGAAARLYVDGVEVGRGSIADIIGEADATRLFLGVNDWDTPFNGIIDELKITSYDAAGTADVTEPVLPVPPEVSEEDLVTPMPSPTPTEEPEPTASAAPTPTKAPAGVTLNKTSASMEIGGALTLTATVEPEGSDVTWKSSDDSVAVVDANGTVTAVKAGTAIITAALKDNDKVSATCKVLVMASVDTNLTDESQLGTGGAAIVYDRVSVHDPSIVIGYYEGTYSSSTKVYGAQNAAKTRKEIYFIFGSHMAWAYSFDLKNWKKFENNINADFATIFAVDAEWSAHGSKGAYDLSGNLWAPDVIWNPSMNKWCMYMSVNGDNWFTSVILLTSDSLNGSWTRVGPVVYSGFTKSEDSWAKNQTDLFDVIGGSTIPERYKETSSNGRALYGMNAIDPCVLYDDDGLLWMAYGSWFGGIYMLKLDVSTGLRDSAQTYETIENTSDAYQGIKLAGGTNASGEAPYIRKIDGKYYLFLSYGGLTATGGYNMRVFSSDSITGPYKDLSGEDARYGTKNTDTTSINAGNLSKTTGSQLMNYYRWGFMNTGFTAEGHNSAFVDDDGKSYVIYHTRFDDGTEGHEVRVHQLFQAKNNGLAAAPFEYSGETLSGSAYDTSKIVGDYNVILQKPTNYAGLECNTDDKITLSADGKVTGAYTGTWEQANDGPYVTIKLGSDTYEGVFLIQRMEETGSNAMCFTAVGSNDLALWGYKAEDLTVAISETLEQLNRLIPASTAVDIALPAEGVHGATISWKSNGIVMTDSGAVNPLKNDMDVVMTAAITSGKYTFSKDYTIKVLGTDSVKTDTEVEIKSYYTDTALDISKLSKNDYVQLANPFYNTLADISNGAVISFDVTRKGNEEAVLSNILSLMGTTGRLYFTGGSYLGYNGPGGFYDANVDNINWSAGNDLLTTNQSVNIKLKFTSDGFEVYQNGTLAYSKNTLEAGATKGGFNFGEGSWSTLNNSLMNWLKNGAPYLNIGYGNWWDDEIFNGTISNIKFSYVQKAIDLGSNGSSLVGIYTQDYENVKDISAEWIGNESDKVKLSEDSEHGRFFLYDSPSGAGNRSAYNLFGTKVEKWPDCYQIDFDLGLKSGNVKERSESQFAIACASSFKGNTVISSTDYIVSLNCPQPSSDVVSTEWQINGDANRTVTIPSADKASGGWVHVTLQGNKTDGTGRFTITSGDTSIYDEAVTVPTDKTPTGFYVLNGRGSGLTKVDNIVVKEQGTDYANLFAYNSVLERANKFKAMQEEKTVFTEASFNALISAIATAESTVTPNLTSSQQDIVDGQVAALTAAIDGLALEGYTVTIGAAENGTVEGLAAGGSYSAGTSVSLTAKPAGGYVFGGWKLGTDDTIVSKNASYSAMVAGDITITPVFVKAADLTEFNEIMASAEKIIAEQSASQVYTEETFSVLQQAVITARVAVPSTLSEADQPMVEVQIEALQAAIDGLKKIGSTGDTQPENPDDTTPTPTPAPGEGDDATPTPTPGEGDDATPTPTPGGGNDTTPTPTPGGNTTPGGSGGGGGIVIPPTPSTKPTPGVSPAPSKSPTPGDSPKPTASTAPGTTSTPDVPTLTPGVPGNQTPTPPAVTPVPSNKNTVKKNKVYSVSDKKFKVTSVTSKKKTVTLTKVTDKSLKNLKVGDTVKIKNQSFKITAIAPKAFVGCKKLETVTIGKNITSLGAQCFANCPKLKKVIFKTGKLNAVGKNAFKGINKNAVIKVPKAKLAKYEKLLKKKVQPSTVRITK